MLLTVRRLQLNDGSCTLLQKPSHCDVLCCAPPCPAVLCRVENGKMFEEIYLDKVIAEERSWRSKTDIDVQMGIARDDKTQLVLASR